MRNRGKIGNRYSSSWLFVVHVPSSFGMAQFAIASECGKLWEIEIEF